MKKHTISYLSLLFIAFSFTACTSDAVTDETTPKNATADYWPTTVANNWVYTQNNEESTIKILGTSKINGKKYYQFNQLDIFGRAVEKQSPFSINKNNGDYYIKVAEKNTTEAGATIKFTGYEFLFFKDYLAVKDTWKGTYTYTQSSNKPNSIVLSAEVTYTGEILEKEISLTVNGKVFKDVIKFRFTQIHDGKDDAWPDWDYSTNYWIAKNVGIIKFDNNQMISELKSHTIK